MNLERPTSLKTEDQIQEPIDWCKYLFPLHRTISGKGNLPTLEFFKKKLPNLKIKSWPIHKNVGKWKTPKKWICKEAWIRDSLGNNIVNLKDSNLHIVQHSISVKGNFSYNQIKDRIHYCADQPDAIPYKTSYYVDNWGFCVTESQLNKLKLAGKLKILIDASFESKPMPYGEILIKGRTQKEIFFSTYICHPSMANNELSGPVVCGHLFQYLQNKVNLNYSYRCVFIPETIGSIFYIDDNLERLKRDVIAGYNVTCVGDNRCYSYLPSRNGNTYSDEIAKFAISSVDKNYKAYDWFERGSDERQYCSPNVDLPIGTITRSKYNTYKEYHTSKDNIGDVVTSEGLESSIKLLLKLIYFFENNRIVKSNSLGEPRLSGYDHPLLSKGLEVANNLKAYFQLIGYADGQTSLLSISKQTNVPFEDLVKASKALKELRLIDEKFLY